MRTTIFVLFAVLHVFNSSVAAHVDTVLVESESMYKSITNVVITPDNYANSDEQYPVIYVLHGAGGDAHYYLNKYSDFASFADEHQLIIVCPDGEKTSWYLDSPVDSAFRYETYMVQELVPAIDARYRTMDDRASRAIFGLSMGGHGAFYLAFRNPKVWGACGSMSGGMNLVPFSDRWALVSRLGPFEENVEVWKEHSIYYMLHLIEGKDISMIFDCGVDDFFYDVNKQLHNKMLENRIPHEFIVRPGGHSRDYWGHAMKYQFLFFDEYFEAQEIQRE